VVRGVTDVVSAGHTRQVALRTRAIDDAVRRGLGRGARQLVLVGAGLDGRAYRLAGLEDAVTFELDHPATQSYKRARAAKLVPKAQEVRYAALDFERASLETVLAGAGHARGVPSVFVWEGVTVYLTREAAGEALRAMAACSAPSSTLVLTYIAPHAPTPMLRLVHALVRRAGEPHITRYAPAEMRQLVESAGFEVERDETMGEGVAGHVLSAVRRGA